MLEMLLSDDINIEQQSNNLYFGEFFHIIYTDLFVEKFHLG